MKAILMGAAIVLGCAHAQQRWNPESLAPCQPAQKVSGVIKSFGGDLAGFSVVSLCVLIAGVVSAQDYRGSVVGRVTDGTGAVVPGANITVVNEGTNVPSATRSNGEGHYLVPLLEP